MSTETLTIDTVAQAPATSRFLRDLFASLRNPLTYLRANEELRRFRSMDVSRLADLGLTEADLKRATLGDFLHHRR